MQIVLRKLSTTHRHYTIDANLCSTAKDPYRARRKPGYLDYIGIPVENLQHIFRKQKPA